MRTKQHVTGLGGINHTNNDCYCFNSYLLRVVEGYSTKSLKNFWFGWVDVVHLGHPAQHAKPLGHGAPHIANSNHSDRQLSFH